MKAFVFKPSLLVLLFILLVLFLVLACAFGVAVAGALLAIGVCGGVFLGWASTYSLV